MKKNITFLLVVSLLVGACTNTPGNKENPPQETASVQDYDADAGDYSRFIPIDTANKMLSSYINSTGADSEALRSIIFNADSLRLLLSDENIKSVKIMLAHSTAYINNGGKDKNCGYQSGNLTFIISGFDADNNYRFYPDQKVLEMGAPCPRYCPVSGTASNNLFSTD